MNHFFGQRYYITDSLTGHSKLIKSVIFSCRIMNRLFSYTINHHQDISRYLVVIFVSAGIAFFLPKTKSFKYDFSVGKPWRYENLEASFDFGIYKTEDELASEKKLMLDEFVPYYLTDKNVQSKKTEQFIVDFNKKITDDEKHTSADSSRLLKTGISILEKIYFRGIINAQETESVSTSINLLENENTAVISSVSDFYSMKDAVFQIKNSLKNLNENEIDFLLPLLEDALDYNILYDRETSSKFRDELLKQVSLTRGKVQEGELIINKGAIVTPEKYKIIESFKVEYEKRVSGQQKTFLVWTGNFGIVFFIMIVLLFFLRYYSPKIYESNRKVLFIYFLITAMIIIVSSFVKTGLPILYSIPFCIVPIIVRTFFGPNTAMHCLVALMMISGFIVPMGNDYIVLNLLAGMVAIFYNVKSNYWSRFFVSNGSILATYIIAYLLISVSHDGSLSDVVFENIGWLGLNVLFTLLVYPFIPMFEKMFGFVSEITLFELQDINKPLLKELSIKAPGTFQHSLQVANLAEASAYEIGANAMLAKTGSLYHDIGKTIHPTFFIENQISSVNPHDELTFEESAKIIIRHVSDGIELAKKNKLPDVIIDFIRTHHGSSRVEYFYQSFLKNFPEETIDESQFSYPGPLPYNKETAIVMMADTVEAAARSFKNPTKEMLDEMVDKLIGYKIAQNQFINSDITFKDINAIKKVLKKMLQSMYHARLEYPS
jgi:cyclic-di-AMP phosphodiesterase PgpH